MYYEKLIPMLKRLVLKFRPDLSSRLKDIAEKQAPAKLKLIVVHKKSKNMRVTYHVDHESLALQV